MATLAVFNPKGGVGRTTTALNLLAAIARRGERPLAIDLDPLAQLSRVFDAQPKRADESIVALFTQNRPLADIAQFTRSGVLLCPAHPDLARLDALIGRGVDAITRLARALRQADGTSGPVVIDCDRLLGTATLNAVAAADLLLVPVSCDYLSAVAAVGMGRAVDALAPALKRRVGRRYLLTRWDAMRPMAEAVAGRLAAEVPADEICATRIRECASVAESPALGLDVFRHAPESEGAADYEALRAELADGGFLR